MVIKTIKRSVEYEKKKVIVSGVLCVSISIASVLCGCSSQTENKTGDAFIINNGGEYYINGLVAKMESDGSAKSVGYSPKKSQITFMQMTMLLLF